jgi:hypothetical protein
MPRETPAPRPVGIDLRVAALSATADGHMPVTSGRVRRAAAELLDVLADERAEQAEDETREPLGEYGAKDRSAEGLLVLIAAYVETAAEAQNLPWNPQVAEAIEAVAFQGLRRTSHVRPSHDRQVQAAGFDKLPARQQRAWLTSAARYLHRTGDPAAYASPETSDPATTPPAWS